MAWCHKTNLYLFQIVLYIILLFRENVQPWPDLTLCCGCFRDSIILFLFILLDNIQLFIFREFIIMADILSFEINSLHFIKHFYLILFPSNRQMNDCDLFYSMLWFTHSPPGSLVLPFCFPIARSASPPGFRWPIPFLLHKFKSHAG